MYRPPLSSSHIVEGFSSRPKMARRRHRTSDSVLVTEPPEKSDESEDVTEVGGVDIPLAVVQLGFVASDMLLLLRERWGGVKRVKLGHCGAEMHWTVARDHMD